MTSNKIKNIITDFLKTLYNLASYSIPKKITCSAKNKHDNIPM